MKKITSVLLFSLLMFLYVYGVETAGSVKPDTVKNQKNETVQASQSKEDMLEVFNKLNWERDMDHAFERAKRENKNVMILVEDTRCKWCINMKVGALSDPRVQERLKAYVLLIVQRSDKKTAQRIEDFAGAIPSLYFMEPNQEIYESIVGYFATEDFLSYLVQVEEDN